MKKADVSKCADFAKNAGATGILFLLYKPTKNNENFDILFPDLQLCREITAEIINLRLREKDKFEVSVDSCLLGYTVYNRINCYDYYISPVEKVSPYGDIYDYYSPHKCPINTGENCYIQDLYRSQLLMPCIP